MLASPFVFEVVTWNVGTVEHKLLLMGT